MPYEYPRNATIFKLRISCFFKELLSLILCVDIQVCRIVEEICQILKTFKMLSQVSLN